MLLLLSVENNETFLQTIMKADGTLSQIKKFASRNNKQSLALANIVFTMHTVEHEAVQK